MILLTLWAQMVLHVQFGVNLIRLLPCVQSAAL